MKESLENLPIEIQAGGVVARKLGGWGGMAATHVELPAGADFAPLLEGLPDGKCACPHWGYVLKGSIHWRYTDGTEEVVNAGDVFYTPSGHTGWVEEDTAFLDFSPENELAEVQAHIKKKLSAMG